MTRSHANTVALEIMKAHLQPGWYMKDGGTTLSMRGVQIKQAIAAALIEASTDGYEAGCSDTREAM